MIKSCRLSVQKHNYNNKNHIVSLVLFVLMFILGACAKDDEVATFYDIKVGMAPIIQPEKDTELLAGYFLNPRSTATSEELQDLQIILEQKLANNARQVIPLEMLTIEKLESLIPARSSRGILDYWYAYGTYYDLDFLIVPYLYYYNNKTNENSVLDRNALSIDYFLIDIGNKGGISHRVHYAHIEPQDVEHKIEQLDINSLYPLPDKATIQDMFIQAYEEMAEGFQI